MWAGDFASWVTGMEDAIAGRRASDVPCDGCTACCTASQFIHIGPEETDTLAHIPAQLLFPAPRLPSGHVLLGYDEQGHCPMLVNNRCSIYEHRPRTCRTYDCRVFAAAGVTIDDKQKVLINQRVRQWQFSFAAADDHHRYAAVQAAATFLRQRAGELPNGTAPVTSTQLAVLALRIHTVFLSLDEQTGEMAVIAPDLAVVCAEVLRQATV